MFQNCPEEADEPMLIFLGKKMALCEVSLTGQTCTRTGGNATFLRFLMNASLLHCV